MNRSYLKTVFREIRRSTGRFFAILAISLLGVGFLVGLLACTPDMKLSMDAYYDENNLWDLRILSTIGIDKDEAEEIRSSGKIKQLEGAYFLDAVGSVDDAGQIAVRLHSISENFNKLTLVEGRLPQTADECVAVRMPALSKSVSSGMTLSIDDYKSNNLSTGRLKVVGIVDSPQYISNDVERTTVGSGRIQEVFYVSPQLFTGDVYSELLVELDGARELIDFNPKYTALIESATDELKPVVATSLEDRRQKLAAEVLDKIADGEKQISENENLLDERLGDARAELNSARAGLDRAQKDLDTKRAELDRNRAELSKNIADLNGVVGAEYQLAELGKSLAQLDAGIVQLDTAQKDIDASRNEINRGFDDLNSQEQTARSEIATAKKDLDRARDTLKSIEAMEYFVLDREAISGHYTFGDNIEKVNSISKVFPVFFFLVAVLVALTTMTRMIDEERTQIGTLKALGYGRARIMSRYLIYSGAASIIGAIGGILIGFKLFPSIVFSAYELMYRLPALIAPIHIDMAIVATVILVGGILLTTVAAGFGILLEVPASLMIAKAPKPGKRIFLEYIKPLWRSMSFTQKVAARNLFRYKRRLFLTIIGIAGCTALLVSGFGLRDSISDIVDKQYNELFNFNLTATLSADTDEDKSGTQYDREFIENYIGVNSETVTVGANGVSDSVTLVVPESTENFHRFINLRERVSHKNIEFSDSSVIISEKMANILGVKVGDSIEVELANRAHTLKLTGIAENYVYSYLFMPKTMYENRLGEVYSTNTVYMQTKDSSSAQRDAYTERMLESGAVSSVIFSDDVVATFKDMLSRIDVIVVVIIVCAGILAFVVLYNLININIAERKKELATIKVLGFYNIECAKYVYRETAVLTVIGAIIGLILGVFLHSFIVVSAETTMVMFGRDIAPLSYVFSFLTTIVFSVLVNLVMYNKIRYVNMVESLKEE